MLIRSRWDHAVASGVLAMGLFAATSAAQTKPSGTVVGHVTTGDAKTPLVVFLDAEGGAPIPAAATHKMAQRGMRFLPEFLDVAVGDKVAFPNDDKVTHNVFSISRAKRFDLALYPPGQNREVLFDKPGVVDVFCNIHEHMHAVIVVVPAAHHRRVDDRGDFRLDGVGPGRYALVAWRKGKEVGRRSVVVEAGVTTTIQLAAP